MSDWQVGDLAVCVKDTPWVGARYGSAPDVFPQNGCVYCVTSIQIEGPTLRLRFAEFGHHAWNVCGFRKIRPDEREACEPEFVTLLKRSKQTVRA